MGGRFWDEMIGKKTIEKYLFTQTSELFDL